ncbi:MAG: SIS domain-containing protein [Beijerinckiaceae bacterium]
MALEIAECPRVAELSTRSSEDIERLAGRFAVAPPPLVVLCGRGSSGNAALFLRYLIETRLRIPVSIAAPSVTSVSGARIGLREAWFVVVSQSGESPDLIAATRAAREAGALTIGLLNRPQSALGEHVEVRLPLQAGDEFSVAATKSVLAAMALGARLVAQCGSDNRLHAALDRLPARTEQAIACDWSFVAEDLCRASAVYTLGRGLGLAVAKEVGLKICEVLRRPALAYSAAEILHGPRAAISNRTPVLGFKVEDETAASVGAAMQALREGGATTFTCGAGGDLPWLAPDHPATDAIAMLPAAWRLLEALAWRLGHDPDRPPFLKKVTKTL